MVGAITERYLTPVAEAERDEAADEAAMLRARHRIDQRLTAIERRLDSVQGTPP